MKIHKVLFLAGPSSKPVPLVPMVGEARMLGCSISPGTWVRDGTEVRGSVQVDVGAKQSERWLPRCGHVHGEIHLSMTVVSKRCDLATLQLITHCDIPQSPLSCPSPKSTTQGAGTYCSGLAPGPKHLGTNASPFFTSYSNGRTRLSLYTDHLWISSRHKRHLGTLRCLWVCTEWCCFTI